MSTPLLKHRVWISFFFFKKKKLLIIGVLDCIGAYMAALIVFQPA